MEESDGEQIISPLSILIKCTSNLYKAMHSLSPFTSGTELGRGMRARVILFLANEGWDANHILDLKIKGSVESIQNTEQSNPVKSEALALARSNTPVFNSNLPYAPNVTNHCLIGCDAMPGPTPELSAITNHHLKTLSSLNKKMRWDEHDLLDPRVVSVHAWQCKVFAMLSIIPFAQNVLDQKMTTFEDADSILSSIIMWSFSNKLCIKYFAEHGDKPIPITVDLFNWAVNKCKAHSTTKEYELSMVTLDLHWDQVGSHTYNFLVKWEAHVSELHKYLQDLWKPDYHYKTLKRALPSDQNALFNSVFILHKKIHGRDQTVESVTDILCQCYKLAADITPMSHHCMTEESKLTAL